MFKKIATLLEMIKFKHTIFALPFALMGAFLAADGSPTAWAFSWVILAMAGARTCAMGFNRIVDARFDAKNSRTAKRAIPAGEVKIWEAWIMVLLAGTLFFLACYNLNYLTLALSPLALALTLFYSLTKRFTWLCHVVLGVALAFAPLGGFVAVKGSLAGFPYVLSLAVLLWVAGFDMVYACMDVDFDRREGLYSLPVVLGRRWSFRLAAIFHLLAFLLFLATGIFSRLSWPYYVGLAAAACCLIYQHIIVKPDDLSKIRVSFFQMNGLVSLILFFSTWLALLA